MPGTKLRSLPGPGSFEQSLAMGVLTKLGLRAIGLIIAYRPMRTIGLAWHGWIDVAVPIFAIFAIFAGPVFFDTATRMCG